MTALPLIHRELISGARSPATYWTRCAVALVGVLICMQSMNAGLLTRPSALGRYVFNAVIGAAFLVCCSVCLLSADAISAERREGTLELLFLTGVKPLDVLLGKLGSVGLTSICSLAAFLPALLVPLFAGGVTPGEALRKGLGLLNLLFFALVAGLWSSAAERERFRASRAAVLLLTAAILLPFFVMVVATRTLPTMFALLSPLSTFLVAGDAIYPGARGLFWTSLGLVQAVSWTLLVVAGVRLRAALGRHSTQLSPAPPEGAATQKSVGLMSWQPTREQSSPVEWLVYRRFSVGALLWGAASLALAYNGWVALLQPLAGRRAGLFTWLFAWPFAITAGLVGATVVAWVASRFFVGVRRSGDLELLMTTPVGATTIVSEQWRVLLRLFVWPVLVMQAPMFPQLVASLDAAFIISGGYSFGPLALYKLLSLLNILLGVAALCWVGLWFGLKARTQAAAIVWSVGLAKGLPALCSLVGVMVADAVATGGGAGGVPTLVLCLPELVNACFYAWLIWYARQHLLADLASAEPLPFSFPASFEELQAALRSLRSAASAH